MKNVKKILSGILVGVLLTGGIVGCGDSKTEEKKPQKQKEEVKKEINYDSGITYEDLARAEDGRKGEYVTLSGEVIQVIQSDKSTAFRIAVDGDYNNIIYAEIQRANIRILENDYVKLKGQSVGYISYDSIFGEKISLVGIDAHEIVASSKEDNAEQVNAVLIDNENITITLNSISKEYGDTKLNLTIENKTGGSITANIDNVIIGGYTIDAFLYTQVNGGTKTIDSITLYKDDLSAIGNKVTDLSTTIKIMNDNYDTIGEYTVNWIK